MSENVRLRTSIESNVLKYGCNSFVQRMTSVHRYRTARGENNAMSRTFAYCRVSSSEQSTDNQVQEIASAGFSVTKARTIVETVSGSVAARERKEFVKLLDKIKPGDILIVTKLDRLGRNAMDVRSTVELLESIGVKVHCLALGGVDLTSPAGQMTMQVISPVAEFERDLLIERTNSGIKRAQAERKKFGRPVSLTGARRVEVLRLLSGGIPVAQLARQFDTTRQTIMRIRAASLTI